MGNILVSPTADHIASRYKLDGKTAVITGGTGGIGLETTRSLVKRGATVVLTCRDASSGEKSKEKIIEELGQRFHNSIKVMELDLSSFKSIEFFVERFRELNMPLDYLILNAAVLGGPYTRTQDGFEMHFGVNYLGHFYLTQLLLPIIEQQKLESVRIVVVCCLFQAKTKLRLKNFGKRGRVEYNALTEYAQSKLALRGFAEELSINSEKSNLCVVGADPGLTATWIIKNLNPIVIFFHSLVRAFMKTPAQGAATVVFACLDRRVPLKIKPFCSKCRLSHLKAAGYDTNTRKELYALSSRMVKLNPSQDSTLHESCQEVEPKSKLFGKFAQPIINKTQSSRYWRTASGYSKIE